MKLIKNTLYLCPIEVKQGDKIPTWNNNPPKANFCYFFVCKYDRQIYFQTGKNIRGNNIVTDDIVKLIHTTMCKVLQNKMYSDDNKTRVISYKKIEPQYFPKHNYYDTEHIL
jgi:hypothetical protein